MKNFIGVILTLVALSSYSLSFVHAQDAATDNLPSYAGLIVNELLPDPSGTDSGNEFIELYNKSSVTINLEGLSLRDNSGKSTYTFAPGEVIQADSYRTIYNKTDFKFTLNNTFDEVTLFTSEGKILDSLSYESSSQGMSWNADSQPYEQLTSPNTTNLTSDTSEEIDPSDPPNNDRTTNASDDQSVQDQEGEVPTEDSPTDQNTPKTPTNNETPDTSDQDTTDDPSTDQNSTDSTPAESPSAEPADDQATFPPILLSEIYANPYGPDTTGEFIELFNPTDTDASLTNWKLRDASTSGSYTFGDGTVIRSQNFHTIFRATSSIALNNTGDEIVSLLAPNGSVINTFNYSGAPEGTSHARIDQDWKQTLNPTPNSTNIFTEILQCKQPDKPSEKDQIPTDQSEQQTELPLGESPNQDDLPQDPLPSDDKIPSIILSELLPNPAGADASGEFIELYNPTDQTITLKGWTLQDASSGGSYTFTPDSQIDALSYLSVDRSVFGFALNNTGQESVTLRKPGQSISSTVTYSDLDEGISYSFNGDAWRATTSITKGQQNIFTLPEESSQPKNVVAPTAEKEDEIANTPTPIGPFYALELSEAYPNPTSSSTDEFIEIYNPHGTEVNLLGYTITDASKSGSFTFGIEDVIPPKSYKAFDRTKTKIALNNTGTEVVTLKNPEGAVNATVTFISIAKGKSFARIDGAWRVTTSPTPSTANVLSSTPISTEDQKIELSQEAQETQKAASESLPEGPFPPMQLSEILPNPTGSDTELEFVEIYNPNDRSVDLEKWILRDASKSGKYIISNLIIQPKQYGVISRSQSGLALNNAGQETLSLYSPDEKLVTTFTYTGADEGVSYNFDGTTWQMSALLTPGLPNAIQQASLEEKNQPELPGLDDTSKPIILDVYPQVLISEILPNPQGDETRGEFIELYNPTANEISLLGWSLSDATQRGVYMIGEQTILADGYLTIYRNDFGFALNNTGAETVTLLAPNQEISDALTYSKTTEGVSLGRKILVLDEPFLPTLTPTPNGVNTFARDTFSDSEIPSSSKDALVKPFPKLFLSELLPSPSAGQDEYIELYNPQNIAVSLAGWTLRDASKNGKYTFNNQSIDPGEYLFISRDIYKFALNNTGGETVSLYDPVGTLSSSVSYQKAAKDISYGWTGDDQGKLWRFSAQKTPGSKNIFAQELDITDIDIDNKYKDAKTEFDVDVAGASDFKVSWDFGDGKKSTKKNPTHTYKKTGTYQASVEVISNIESKRRNFEVKIKKYPKRKIDVTQIYPNPQGKDTGKETNNEYLVITNNDKKSVNLDGWSIATGKDIDSLSNHPFKKKIKLKKGESKQITKKHSAISLNNAGGTIEIRTPDGSVVDEVSYDYAQARTIPEGLTYTKLEDTWTWSTVTDAQKSLISGIQGLQGLSAIQQQEIISRALENMSQSDTQTIPQPAGEFKPKNKPGSPPAQNKKTLWEILKSKIKGLFGAEAKSHLSTSQSFTGPSHHISHQYSKEICKANPSVVQSSIITTHCHND